MPDLILAYQDTCNLSLAFGNFNNPVVNQDCLRTFLYGIFITFSGGVFVQQIFNVAC